MIEYNKFQDCGSGVPQDHPQFNDSLGGALELSIYLVTAKIYHREGV